MDAPSPLPDDSTPIPTAPSSTTPASSNQQSSTPKFSNGLHIRSRITVVCAECKRLKLRCDRRNPCGSCVKRDTVQRCQYTAAAAEKIDVQSLHNRLQIVESQIAQIYAGGIRVPTALASVSSDTFPFPHNERTILAVGGSGSSVTVSLDDVAALWLEYLDLPRSCLVGVHPSCSSSCSSSSAPVKLEPYASDLAVHDEPPFTAVIPSFSIYFPASTSQAAVTSPLISLLPSATTARSRITTALEETMKMHPCFNIKHFRNRADSMFAWAKDEDGRGPGSGSNAKADLARSIFFPTSCPPPSVAPVPRPTPTLSFFASVSVAYALGVLVCKENEMTSDIDAQKASMGPKNPRLEDNRTGHSQKAAAWGKYSASGLFALSRQAMAAFEMAHTYDMDSVVTYLLQIVYLLHDSRPRVAHIIYPLLGKLIHIAHMMGLSTDPDEFPGKYSLFEAEQRRRVWWDIYYYDVFISDAMGQLPSIQDGTYTTKPPADVDEELFGPSSTSLPLPLPRRAGGDPTEVGFAYFIQKCRLAQLVKSVKRRCPRDNPNDSESSIERAEQFESEVKTWLSELPKAFRFDANNTEATAPSSRATISPNLQAQRCELAIIANQLILKVFLPFLKNCTGPASDGLPRRVVSSVIDAGHTAFQAMRILHSTWRQTQPASFLFYSVGRTLFDTAVMMACAVIAHPSSASSSVAIADVSAAIDIMQDTRMGSERRSKHDDPKDLPEVVKIITLLKTKAEAKRAGDDIVAGPSPAIGSKRKHDESPDSGSFADDFELPYVGAGVKASHSSSEPSVETTPKAPTSVPKTRTKQQRSGSVLPSDSCRATEGLQLTDRDAGQIPVRGRPRTESTVQHRNSSSNRNGSSKYTTSTSASAHSQSGTPAPDQPGFHAVTRPESRPQMCSSDFDASIYATPSSGYESSGQLPPHYSIPPSMPPPQAPLILASPSYASMSGSNSSSQSSPAYSQGPMASPHAFGQPGQELYNIQGPATPSYDSPLAGLGMTVGEPQSHHSSVPPEEPPYMMGSTDPNVRQLSFPAQQNGAIGLQNLPHSFGPSPHGLLSTSAWQPDDGLPPRQNTGDTWQDFGKFHH